MNTITKILMFVLCMNPMLHRAQNSDQKKNVQQESNYNPETVVTIDAEIVSVKEIQHNYGKSAGIHLEIKSSSGLQIVHVGPNWYVNEQNITLNKGDNVTITGSKVSLAGQPVLIAKQIKKGSQSLELRADNGTPLWSGQGKRKK